MSRVAVTGGTGKLGRTVVADLRDHGYDVVNLDQVAPPGRERAPSRGSTSPTSAR